MKRTELVHVAVAETSVIVRSGLVAVLKRMPDLIIQPVEITSLEGLQNCMQGHQPDILIINPTFGGWFNVDEFKSNYPQAYTKCVSLLCYVAATNLFTLSHTGGLLDPEQDGGSTTGDNANRGWRQPQNKTISLGMNITF